MKEHENILLEVVEAIKPWLKAQHKQGIFFRDFIELDTALLKSWASQEDQKLYWATISDAEKQWINRRIQTAWRDFGEVLAGCKIRKKRRKKKKVGQVEAGEVLEVLKTGNLFVKVA